MLYQLSYAHHIALLVPNSLLACPAGLEPATIRLEGGCSIQLSYGHLAVLDKRGECYIQLSLPSTVKRKKFSEIKELREIADQPPLPARLVMRECASFFNHFRWLTKRHDRTTNRRQSDRR